MGNPRFQEGSAIRRLFAPFMLVIFLILLLSGCTVETGGSNPAAANGVIDLRQWSFERDGQVELSGQWSFYGGQLLVPGDPQLLQDLRHVMVPRSWNSYKGKFGMQKGEGYATYKLTVLLTPRERVLALRVPNIFSSYTLWINGKEMARQGQVGTSRATSVPQQYPRIVSFASDAERVDILIQVSNFQHRKGGIWVPILLGNSDTVVDGQMKTTAKEMLILGSLVIIGVYHIGLYAFRRQEKFTIHFGLLCLFVAARASVTGENYPVQLFPIPWEGGLKIEYISFALSAVSGYLYVYRLFPMDASKKVIRYCHRHRHRALRLRARMPGDRLLADAGGLPTLRHRGQRVHADRADHGQDPQTDRVLVRARGRRRVRRYSAERHAVL